MLDDPIFTSTRQAEVLNPALVATHQPLAGPVAALDIETGNAISCAPHALYGQRRITSPNIVVLGDVGVGKSSWVKDVYVADQVAMGAQVAVFDRKDQEGRGEYDQVAAVCGGTTVRFSRTHGTPINLLDPRIATVGENDVRVGQDQLLLLAAEYAHGPLSSFEDYALRAAHKEALRRAQQETRVANLRDVIDALFAPTPIAIPHGSVKDIVDVTEVQRWGLALALDLKKFVDGELSGLIDAETSDAVDWSSQLLVFDTSDLDENSKALSLVMALVATFLTSVWAATPGQRVIVLEEGYHTTGLQQAGSISVAALLRTLVKRGRGMGLAFVTVLHHISDIPLESDAMSLIREAEVLHVFQQSRDDDRATAIRELGLPSHVGEMLQHLSTGNHLLKIGREATRHVQHLRSTLAKQYTYTDNAMIGDAA